LQDLMQQKTTLIIAHRLSTVLNADRILVLEQGRLLASGSHSELVATCPLYRELAELQLLA
jgi:ATP-binding cassette subfamily B protein